MYKLDRSFRHPEAEEIYDWHHHIPWIVKKNDLASTAEVQFLNANCTIIQNANKKMRHPHPVMMISLQLLQGGEDPNKGTSVERRIQRP
jgi:hypothetical protein